MKRNKITITYFTGEMFHKVDVFVPNVVDDLEMTKYGERIRQVALSAAIDFEYEGGVAYETQAQRSSRK